MDRCCKCKTFLGEENRWYGLHHKCFMEWFNLSELSHFLDIIPRSQSLAPVEEGHGQNTSFFHGAFRKYSSKLGENDYILKVIQEGHPELPATEFLCNQIYESLGVEIPAYHLVRYPEHHFCFVTRNFMSKLQNSSLVHIYHYLKGREYDCETLISVIGEMTGRRTEQEKFAYLILADSLIGNHDRHGRNLGFIQTPKGMQLAPFYDNPSFVGLDNDFMLGADLQPRGKIFTKDSNEPTMKDYIKEWQRLGYDNVIEKFRKSYLMDKVNSIIEESFLTEKRKKALINLISKRSKEL